jgi:hypothetical protein
MFGRSVRASGDERLRALPGDELIEDPVAALTHAVTVRKRARDVWPWLVQMGAGTRAGWYSYDCLDNRGVPSAMHIIPALQGVAVGMLMPALPGATDGFTVIAHQAERFLVIGWADTKGAIMTWAFALEETPVGWTRLVVRVRGSRRYHFHRLPWWIAKHIVPAIHWMMQRKQLLGIAQRAESLDAPEPGSGQDATAARTFLQAGGIRRRLADRLRHVIFGLDREPTVHT